MSDANRQLEVIRGVYGIKNIDKMEDSFLEYIDEKIELCQSDKYNGIKLSL